MCLLLINKKKNILPTKTKVQLPIASSDGRSTRYRTNAMFQGDEKTWRRRATLRLHLFIASARGKRYICIVPYVESEKAIYINS